jgi:hypothetical protein
MNRWYFVPCIVALCVVMSAQIGLAQYPPPSSSSQPYQPAVPAPSMVTGYGAYPGYGGGAHTAAGSAMSGMANAISAKGNANLSNSAAAVNMTQAQKNEIQNHQQYENTYFQMQQTNQAYQKAQEGPQLTEEQIARMARDAAPRPVSADQVNPTTGQIAWPEVLQEDSFATQRAAVDQLSATKAAHGSLSFSDQMAARKTIESMYAGLKSQIRDVPPQDYAVSNRFLRSLIYALSRADLE